MMQMSRGSGGAGKGHRCVTACARHRALASGFRNFGSWELMRSMDATGLCSGSCLHGPKKCHGQTQPERGDGSTEHGTAREHACLGMHYRHGEGGLTLVPGTHLPGI